MPRSRVAMLLLTLLAPACGQDYENPFDRISLSRPPSAEARILFVSASWASQPGAPRELLATNADGSKIERLTSCAESPEPCDFLQAAPSPDRKRVAAVRTTPDAQPGTAALYYMDLERSVETLVVTRRRVESVDWSPDDSFLIYTAPGDADREDLYYVAPNGTSDQNLSQSPTVRDRAARIEPTARTAVYERIDDETGTGRIYEYQERPLTSGPTGTEALAGTPYVVGGDADPAYSPDGRFVVFRRLTSTGNGGLGTWDLIVIGVDARNPTTIVTGPLFRGAPDWGVDGIAFVETGAAEGISSLVVVQADGSGRRVVLTEPLEFGLASPRWLR